MSSKTLIEKLFRTIDASDWDEMPNLFDAQIVYERPGYAPFSGLERLLYFYQNERVLASGEHRLDRIVIDGNYGACWGRFVGLKKDGTSADVLFADTYLFEGGKIKARRSYFFQPSV